MGLPQRFGTISNHDAKNPLKTQALTERPIGARKPQKPHGVLVSFGEAGDGYFLDKIVG